MCSRNGNDNDINKLNMEDPPMTLLMTCETNNKKKNKYTKIKNIKIVKTTKKKEKKNQII